ncbi:hypothetical protein BDV12DRAFT_34895 [Aspergillus spectabilis]
MPPSAPDAPTLVKEESVKEERMDKLLWDIAEEARASVPSTLSICSASPAVCQRAGQEDPYMTRGEFKATFPDIMRGYQATGSFYTTQSTDLSINPGLEISGVGQIGLPLSSNLAETISKVCRRVPVAGQSPYQESSLGTWELDADQLNFRNPKWKLQVGIFLDNTLRQFGLPTDWTQIRTELHRCLLFGQGSHSLPQHDRTTIGDMFGTLAICLPSEHEGGDIAISYKGETHTWSTCPKSDFNFSCAAWTRFSTVAEEQVTSGYRLVLIYNLLHRPSLDILTSLHARSDELNSYLGSWARWASEKATFFEEMLLPPSIWFPQAVEVWNDSRLPALFHLLEHRYGPSKPSFTKLKGPDKAQIAKLQKACDTHSCRLFLANLEQNVRGEVDMYDPLLPLDSFHSMVDVHDTTFYLRHVIDPAGKVVIDKLETTETMCAYDPFLDTAPDDERWLYGPGTAHGLVTHFYYHTVAVVIPEEFYYPLLLHAASAKQLQPKRVLNELRRQYQDYPGNQRTQMQLHELCDIILKDGHWEKETYQEVAHIGLELLDHDIVNRSLFWLGKCCTDLAESIGKAIARHGLNQMQPILDHLWTLSSVSCISHISVLRTVAMTWASEGRLSGQEISVSEFKGWYIDTISMLFTRLERLEFLGEEEGGLLARLESFYLKQCFEEKVVPIVVKRAAETGFAVSFLASLCETAMVDKLGIEPIAAAYRKILPAVLDEFAILNRHTALRHPLSSMRYNSSRKADYFVRPDDLVKVIERNHLMNIGVRSLLQSIQRSVHNVLQQEPEVVYTHFICPFIKSFAKDLATRASKDGFTAPGSTEATFIVRLLKLYIMAHVGPPPTPPTNWSQSLPNLTNCCADCDRLRAFVEDPIRTEESVRMGEKRRLHILRKLMHGFKWDIDSMVTPNALRVTKTPQWFNSVKKAWTHRADEAEWHLTSLGNSCPVIEVLGHDAYEDLRRFVFHVPNALPDSTVVRQNERTSNPRPAVQTSSQSHNGLGSSTPTPLLSAPTVPRKRSFIDLSGE